MLPVRRRAQPSSASVRHLLLVRLAACRRHCSSCGARPFPLSEPNLSESQSWWEHKSGSVSYFISDGSTSNSPSYTYVIVSFCFHKRQIRAILAGDIHYVMLTFLDRKTLRTRCLVVEGARLAANYVKGGPHFRGTKGELVIRATQLEDNPLRVSSTGQVMHPVYPRDVTPPKADEASSMPVWPFDFDRLVDRCMGRGPAAYAGPFAVAELGEIRGRTPCSKQCPLACLSTCT